MKRTLLAAVSVLSLLVPAVAAAGAAPGAPRSAAAGSPSGVVPAACALPAGLIGKDVSVIPTTSKIVALTFDAGASDAGVDKIISTLKARYAPASFFLTGQFAQRYPAKARAMAYRPLGNHTMDHKDLTTLSDAQVIDQLRLAHRAILTTTGQDPHPYFRFPYGAASAHLVSLANSRCYVPVRWTVDTLGWKGTSGGMTAQKVVDRVVAGLRPGAIVLMHVGANPTDGTTLDADALDRVITEVRARGYHLRTLTRLLPSGE